MQVLLGGKGVLHADVQLSLSIVLTNGTVVTPTQGWPLHMVDDGLGGNLFYMTHNGH